MSGTIARIAQHVAKRVGGLRPNSVFASTEAATWRTFARVQVKHDGSIQIVVTRDGVVIHEHRVGPEKTAS